MSAGVNMAVLVGNVGASPEVRTTQGGTRVTKLSLATNRTYKDKAGAKQEDTQWHRVTVFGNGVDVIERYVNKGDRLYVRGRIEYSTTDGDDGNTRYWTDIICEDFQMLGGGENAPTAEAPRRADESPMPF